MHQYSLAYFETSAFSNLSPLFGSIKSKVEVKIHKEKTKLTLKKKKKRWFLGKLSEKSTQYNISLQFLLKYYALW